MTLSPPSAVPLESDCSPRCSESEPPTPQWALDAAAEHDRADLASAARSDLSHPSGRSLAGLRALELCDPVALAEAGHGRGLLDGIVAAQRMIARVQALQQRWIAAFARPGVALPLADVIEAASTSLAEKFGAHLPDTGNSPGDDAAEASTALAHPLWRSAIIDTASRFAAAEIACATHLAPITARMRVEQATMMVNTLPATLAAQQAGHLDGYRAAIIADGVTALPAGLRSQVERKVLRSAANCTASELRRRVARAVIASDPTGSAERAARAAESRHTSITAVDNDMALFRAVLSAPDALIAHGVLDCVASSLKAAGLTAGRGSAQLRADAFADLFRTLATTGHAHVGVPERDSADAAYGRLELVRLASGVVPCRCDQPGGDFCPDHHSEPVEDKPHGREPDRSETGRGKPGGSAAGSRTVTPKKTGGSPSPRGTSTTFKPRVTVNVYVDLPTLAGLADRPGEIRGYGTVTAGTARALAASASSIRALVTHDPASRTAADTTPLDAGAAPNAPTLVIPPDRIGLHSDNTMRSRTCSSVVDPGRAVYRPPEATADYVRARDRHCQFPGCRVSAERCDLDHRLPYESGGATCPCNLDVLCRAHHRLKTFTSWRAEPDASGRLTWTSPLGHTYALAPDSRGSAGSVANPRRLPAVSTGGLRSSADDSRPGRDEDDPPPF